ncbi:MAG TPA: hypothetical protein PLE72_07750 [Azospira sp.]|nr:hypothetical protein [Azospira sp.]HNN46943.1 hypothetical protein [Azospira sp.]
MGSYIADTQCSWSYLLQMIYKIYPSRHWSIFNAAIFFVAMFACGFMAIRTPSALTVFAILFFLMAVFAAFVAGKLLWSIRVPVAEFGDYKFRFRSAGGEYKDVMYSDLRRVEGHITDTYLTGLELTLNEGQTEIMNLGVMTDIPNVFSEIHKRSPHLRQLYSTVMVLIAIKS